MKYEIQNFKPGDILTADQLNKIDEALVNQVNDMDGKFGLQNQIKTLTEDQESFTADIGSYYALWGKRIFALTDSNTYILHDQPKLALNVVIKGSSIQIQLIDAAGYCRNNPVKLYRSLFRITESALDDGIREKLNDLSYFHLTKEQLVWDTTSRTATINKGNDWKILILYPKTASDGRVYYCIASDDTSLIFGDNALLVRITKNGNNVTLTADGTSDLLKNPWYIVNKNGGIARIPKELIPDSAFENEKMTETTYSALVDRRNKSELRPGEQYRIVNYVTTTKQSGTQSAGHQFDIIVTADDNKTLNETARACLRVGDTYFANSNLAAWEIKYCLDNDTNRFAWADTENGRGVIYYMKDEFGNECPYDFKNILFQKEVDKNSVTLMTFADDLSGRSYGNKIKERWDPSIRAYCLPFNTFGGDCCLNWIDSNSTDNTFGDYVSECRIGKNSHNNQICTDCSNIELENHVRNCYFYDESSGIHIGHASTGIKTHSITSLVTVGSNCEYLDFDGGWNIEVTSGAKRISFDTSVSNVSVISSGDYKYVSLTSSDVMMGLNSTGTPICKNLFDE